VATKSLKLINSITMKKLFIFPAIFFLTTAICSSGLVYSQSGDHSFGPATGDFSGNYHPKAIEQVYTSRAVTNIFSWDWNGGASRFAYFDATLPGAIMQIVADPAAIFINACEMVTGDPTKFYAIDANGNAFLVDAVANTSTPLGNTGLTNPLGLALDYTNGEYYLCDDVDNLYKINMGTLNTTFLGTFNYPGLVYMIGITCDGAGNLWGYDLGLNNFYSINKTTGQATLVGYIGFDANFGQGLGYDQATNTMYMCAYNNNSFQAEFRSVNTANGSTTFMGAIGVPGTTQFGSCAIPGEAAEVPLSDWALAIGIILIISAAIIRMRRFS
jgi:hypothetical protein